MVKSLTKHGFNIRLNNDVRQRELRRRSQLHLSIDHPSLRKSINEYNRLSSEIRQTVCKCIKNFKVKLKTMNESVQFLHLLLLIELGLILWYFFCDIFLSIFVLLLFIIFLCYVFILMYLYFWRWKSNFLIVSIWSQMRVPLNVVILER